MASFPSTARLLRAVLVIALIALARLATAAPTVVSQGCGAEPGDTEALAQALSAVAPPKVDGARVAIFCDEKSVAATVSIGSARVTRLWARDAMSGELLAANLAQLLRELAAIPTPTAQGELRRARTERAQGNAMFGIGVLHSVVGISLISVDGWGLYLASQCRSASCGFEGVPMMMMIGAGMFVVGTALTVAGIVVGTRAHRRERKAGVLVAF
jgi:hypothetical protein